MSGPSYGEILNIQALLSLQRPLSPVNHHDELQYVVVHQVSELWFKLLLHELERVREEMASGDLARAAHLLRRSHQIVGLLDQGFALLETMTAYDYAQFRPSLTGGSGFQSAQFRELEILLGCHREFTLNQPAFTPEEQARIQRRLGEPTLWDGFVAAMRRHGYPMPTRAEAGADPAAAKRVEQVLLQMYQGGAHPRLQELSEELAALDNAILRWRTHHALLAERAIGGKVGTGGEGVEYLYKTARIRCFPELIALRALL
ncbi:MAG: tryptophan 2,3-dioxygenase family protein [Bacillota bacterium]